MRSVIHITLISTLITLSFLPNKCKGQAAEFEVEFLGLSEEAIIAFNHATDIWSNYLISEVPIKIVAHMQPLLPGQLGITFPNGELNYAAAPIADVWYASCLANAITGTDLNDDFADIEIYFSSLANWYYGLDENPGPTQYDFVSTVLHEICHGLGFLSLSNKAGTIGSFGLIDASAFAPLTTTFVWPALDTLPSVFDVYLENATGTVLTSLLNPSDELGTELISNQIFFNSPEIIAETGGTRPKIYAPGTFTLGSSLSHWDEATYPVGNDNEFMTPQAAAGHAGHQPGILTLTVLEEIGWEINYDTATISLQNINNSDIKIFPNPTQDILFFERNEINSLLISIINTTGNIVYEKMFFDDIISISLKDLESGMYLIKLQDDSGINYKNVMKL